MIYLHLLNLSLEPPVLSCDSVVFTEPYHSETLILSFCNIIVIYSVINCNCFLYPTCGLIIAQRILNENRKSLSFYFAFRIYSLESKSHPLNCPSCASPDVASLVRIPRFISSSPKKVPFCPSTVYSASSRSPQSFSRV